MGKENNKIYGARQGHSAASIQRGVAAIEFMIVMMVLLPAFYVAVALAVTLLAQQALTQAAAEGARAALRSGSLDQRKTYAMQAVQGGVLWPQLAPNAVTFADGKSYADPCPAAATPAPGQCILHVEVTLSQPLVANWPGLGSLIPQQLVGTAAVTLDTSTLSSSS